MALVDKQVTVAEDNYYASIIDLKREATVSVKVDVLAGPDVEAWTLDEAGFRQFESAGKSFFGGEFHHYPDLRMISVRRDQKTVRLPKGRYCFLIDNSDQGETKPPANAQDDEATLHVTITVD